MPNSSKKGNLQTSTVGTWHDWRSLCGISGRAADGFCALLCAVPPDGGRRIVDGCAGRRAARGKGFYVSQFLFVWVNGVHFALVRFINKAGAQILPPVLAVPLALYFFMPFLVLGIAGIIGRMLRRWVPLVWSLMNGGRI